MPPLPGGFELDHRFLAAAKALLAVAAFALLLWDWRQGARASATWIRFRARALVTLGLLAFAAWWNFGALHGAGRPLHLHDFFHYYIGSKYFAELDYTHLYQCADVAEMQQGRAREVADRWTRNLDTNALERRRPTPAEAEDCVARFGPRWDEFGADIEWFRARMRPRDWAGIRSVFGHNATPAWNAVGYWLTSTGRASDRQILALGLLDPILIAILWTLLWRTFGWQAAAVAVLWWGLNIASAYSWIGGAFLRMDALFLLVVAVCALKTGRGFAAGLALGMAALLRAFPLFLLAGLGVKVLYDLLARGPRVTWEAWRGLAAGAALGAAILFGLSAATWAGPSGGALESWQGFATNSRKHLDTPIANHVGLKPALWFETSTRGAVLSRSWIGAPWESWREARMDVSGRRAPLRYAIVGLFVAFFAFCVRRAPPWMVLVASVALLPFVTTLANYYYGALLLVGVLWGYDRMAGVALAALTALSAAVPALIDQNDDRYFIFSVAVVIFAFFVTSRVPHAARGEALDDARAPAVVPSEMASSSSGRPHVGLSEPRPWHLLFAPAVLVLLFLQAGASGAAPHSIAWPLAAMLLLFTSFWMSLALVLRDVRRAALIATTLGVAACGYFLASDLAAAAGSRLVIPLAYLGAPAAVIVLLRARRRTIDVTTIVANVGSLAAVLVVGVSIALYEGHVRAAAAADRPSPLAVEVTANPPRPDIIVLVLEGYGRADVLRSYYTHDDTLARELRAQGFFVADRAAANYPHMGQSFASAFNLAYLQDLMEPEVRSIPWRRRLGELITRNRLFATLHAAGYRIRSYESEYALLRPQPVGSRPGPAARFTNFEYRLYEGSVFPRLFQAAGLPRGWIPAAVHRQQIHWTLEHLMSEPPGGDDPPTFVFAHLLVPHPPFAFREDGGRRPTRLVMAFNDAGAWHDLARDTDESYAAGYVDSVKFLSAQVPEVVRAILSRVTRPTIIYVHSSHGPASRLQWERPTPTSVRERMGILFAARFPDGEFNPLHSRITPVNAYRMLLNRALGAGLPPLADRAYFSTWDRLSSYTDVTAQVQ